MNKLKGYLQSGIIFIGDPQYMSGPADYKAVAPKMSGKELTLATMVDVTPEDPYNPFRRWDSFKNELGEQDKNLPFPGGFSDSNTGRGVAVQAGTCSSYTVERIADETGKLLELRIKFHD